MGGGGLLIRLVMRLFLSIDKDNQYHTNDQKHHHGAVDPKPHFSTTSYSWNRSLLLQIGCNDWQYII